MNTPEDKERMKKLAEDEPLRLAWAEWESIAQVRTPLMLWLCPV